MVKKDIDFKNTHWRKAEKRSHRPQNKVVKHMTTTSQVKRGSILKPPMKKVAESIDSAYQSYFSASYPVDFMERARSSPERRQRYRLYYRTNPMVGSAIDVLTELPLSKIRLSMPACKSRELAEKSYTFFTLMCKRLKLWEKLKDATHRYWVEGDAFIFAEDSDYDSSDPENYRGWDRLIILPAEQIKFESISFSEDLEMYYVPSELDKKTVSEHEYGLDDERVRRRALKIPEEIRNYIKNGEDIPLDTDPMSGSFCYQLKRSQGSTDQYGVSILERCENDLNFMEKLRQAQAQISSRAMTPKRIVSGEDINGNQLDELRSQVDASLSDPDFTIVSNYPIEWNEMGSSDRLLELSTEYEISERHLMMGLGVTAELLTGEGTYTGNRISLQVINEKFVCFREDLQNYVEEYLFRPIAIKKGFLEKDIYGNVLPIYPKLCFNRLGLKDNQDTFDSLMNLYVKGSLPVDFILDLFNIDPIEVEDKLRRDAGTMNDATFNEVLRPLYGDIGSELAKRSNMLAKVADSLGLTLQPVVEGGGRFE